MRAYGLRRHPFMLQPWDAKGVVRARARQAARLETSEAVADHLERSCWCCRVDYGDDERFAVLYPHAREYLLGEGS